MLPYVVPITLGLLTAAAVVVVLIEVVPKVIEDFEREKERLQRERDRQRVPIPMRAVRDESGGSSTAVAKQGEVGFEVFQRRLAQVGSKKDQVRLFSVVCL
jgi:hypothetical protein